jgi:hypothetical protein
MHFDVPVVAYAGGRRPGTLGDAGLLVQEGLPAMPSCSTG